MKSEFLHKENTGRLIIIFAGWSTDPDFYRHIAVAGWDVMIVFDYSDSDFPYHIFDEYSTVTLFAWSLGVFMASITLPFDRLSLAVAVNGTETPVDDEKGIPAEIYKATAFTLNERNLKKFRMRMCGNHYQDLVNAGRFATQEDPEEKVDAIAKLQKQLDYVETKSKDNSDGHSYWHRVYISSNDRIFPSSSQKKAWDSHESRPEIINLDEPHYVDLDVIIRSALPAKEKVGRHFHKALSTYDDQAKAQRTIAERLTDFPGGIPLPPMKVLEIGPGSGLFTKMFARRFKPREIDFVDLYPLPNFGVAEIEKYHTADAEEWIEQEKNKRFDAIISASAIQWFANPEIFFRNASKLLNPGGFLLCSTFVPGNLVEMKTVNPYGLIYRKVEELEKMIGKYFLFAKLEEEELIINFDSPGNTLRHLKETGVGGGISTGRSPRELLAATPVKLTYRPLYIYAVKAPAVHPEAHEQSFGSELRQSRNQKVSKSP